MHVAFEDLKLEHLYIITPGGSSYKKDEKISVIGIKNLMTLLL
jgi:hypothetical protein